jgi:hypothetical protein
MAEATPIMRRGTSEPPARAAGIVRLARNDAPIATPPTKPAVGSSPSDRPSAAPATASCLRYELGSPSARSALATAQSASATPTSGEPAIVASACSAGVIVAARAASIERPGASQRER